MAEQDSNESKQTDTGGGAYVKKSVKTNGGDFVGRDQHNYGLDIDKLIEALKQALPAHDPTPEILRKTLREFQDYHTRLYEWKKLHNYLNEIVVVLPQFALQVERLHDKQQLNEPSIIAPFWRVIGGKIEPFLAWASEIKSIGKPLNILENGDLQGEVWAIEVYIFSNRIDFLLVRQNFDSEALLEAVGEFGQIASKHMFLTDDKLRETAEELFNLSRIALGSVNRD